jgi:Zn-dependent membrane protease YugP
MIGLSLFYRYGAYGMYYWDPTYILIIISAIISLIAQARVSSAFSKYSRVRSMSGMSGAQAAERLLQSQGIYDVNIQRVSGKLTDHYNPSNKTLNLSENVYDSSSVAAIGVAAHECGHAIQHAKGYAPLALRSTLVPIANIGSKLSWVFIIAGIIFSMNQLLLYIGIIMFSAAVLFQLVTLPVEFNASGRALKLLSSTGILGDAEVSQTRKVLTAAALTYVAAAATAILQLLRLIILFGGRNRD